MKLTKQATLKKVLALFCLAALFASTIILKPDYSQAAVRNLIKNFSFENNLFSYWGIWSKPDSHRHYEFYRAYDAAYGYGSYCGAIEAQGESEEPFSAALTSDIANNKFHVEAGANYTLMFYAKASQNMNIITYLERADDYKALTSYVARPLTTQWQKFIINFTPSETADALLAFVYGDMPAGATWYIDGVRILKLDLTLRTKEVKGYIGEQNKPISIIGIENFDASEIEIQVPYYDNLSATTSTKILHPTYVKPNTIYINLEPGTFAGIGRIFAGGNYLGQFNYNILTHLSSFNPAYIRLNQDMVVYGSGFQPIGQNMFLVVTAVDQNGRKIKRWLSPISTDSRLTQALFRLPVGVISGSMYVQTSFIDVDGKERINKSNSLGYKLKPQITATQWSQRGYEQVGDKLTIYGLGFGTRPVVNFYDFDGRKLEYRSAKVLGRTDIETIEVNTTQKANTFNITVTSEGVESDRSENLNYLAKPRFDRITTKYYRNLYDANDRIQAAKPGDEITLYGQGLIPTIASSTVVNFQGLNTRLQVPVTSIERNGRWVKVIVPSGAQSGYINIIVNGVGSNYLPIEIIPQIVNITPDPIVPGEMMYIYAYGVGPNVNLAKAHFNLTKNNKIVVQPEYITSVNASSTDGQMIVAVKAPLALANNYSSVALQYDHWLNDGKAVLNVRPHITSASINMDTKILTIRGYGFSYNPKEDVITYKYADEDHTVVTPKTKILGIYPTEEGQEIRIQIYDNYHYGYVTVTVGEYTSNEVQFGPVVINRLVRRVEYVRSENRVMGVLYISGYNFGDQGGVLVGTHWAQVHYRSNFFIIAVIDEQYLYDNPVIIARQ